MKISISAASRLTGKHRSTISKVASDLQAFPGPKGAWLYDSRELLQHLYIGSDGAPTASEALRLLSLARTEQVKLQNVKLAGDSFTRDEIVAGADETVVYFRGLLLGLKGKVVTGDDIDRAFDDIREFGIACLPEEKRAAARRELCHDALDATASRIEFLKKELARNDWHRLCQEKLANLRAAYNTTLTDKSESAFAALEQARAEVREASEAEPRSG
jgi:hypothetical protein